MLALICLIINRLKPSPFFSAFQCSTMPRVSIALWEGSDVFWGFFLVHNGKHLQQISFRLKCKPSVTSVSQPPVLELWVWLYGRAHVGWLFTEVTGVELTAKPGQYRPTYTPALESCLCKALTLTLLANLDDKSDNAKTSLHTVHINFQTLQLFNTTVDAKLHSTDRYMTINWNVARPDKRSSTFILFWIWQNFQNDDHLLLSEPWAECMHCAYSLRTYLCKTVWNQGAQCHSKLWMCDSECQELRQLNGSQPILLKYPQPSVAVSKITFFLIHHSTCVH